MTNTPWSFVPSPRDNRIGRVVNAKGSTIIDSEDQFIHVSHMRLIAAAPELLAVVEMVLAHASVEMPPELVRAATAALAKARG